MNKDLKMTLRFVVLIATPLCLVNSLLFSFGLIDFWQEWLKRFFAKLWDFFSPSCFICYAYKMV
jgi:hypothetical protein